MSDLKRRTSLKDLAQELGVSIATVSRALRSSPEIGKEMQQRVKELAKRLNYRPNPFARSLRREATEALQLSTSYDASTRQLTVNVLGRSSSEGGFAGNVHLWLTEDSIVSVQRLEGGGYNFEHVFNNIFRTSATPIEGSPVTIPYANEPQQVIAGTPAIDIRQTDSARLEYTPVSDTMDSEIHYNTLSVPKGCEFSLALADGTRIWVNAGSTLRYPERFAPGKREVFLSGEAYFEVARDTANPFFVKTDRMQLQVLGTSFDISAYPDDPAITTTLLTGSVSQKFESGRQTLLRPSQQSVYTVATGTARLQAADIDAVLAWKNGKFIARDERLEDILRRLGRWYDFQVVYTHPRLKDMRFHIHCERYEKVMDILERVQETYGIRFMEHNGTIYVSQ